MESKYKEAVDTIYHLMNEIHDDEMKRHVSGILTLMLPHDGDPRRGVVQALFNQEKDKKNDLFRNMYKLFGMLLCNMGVSIDEARDELAAAYKVKEDRH